MTLQEQIGLRIYKRRLEMRLTASLVAKRAHIHRNTLSRMEAGEGMSIDSLYAVCGVLAMTLDSVVQRIPPTTSFQLELWPNKRRRLNAVEYLSGDLLRGSDDLYAMPFSVGPIGSRAAKMSSRETLSTLRNGTTQA